MLSQQVQDLEYEILYLRKQLDKTKEVVSLFIKNYNSSDHSLLLPKNRNNHTDSLKSLMNFLS